MNTLEQFTDQQLRQELKRRAAIRKAEKEKVDRCWYCQHWGEINYLGSETQKDCRMLYGGNKYCRFFKSKSGKRYLSHSGSQRACEHFERKEVSK